MKKYPKPKSVHIESNGDNYILNKSIVVSKMIIPNDVLNEITKSLNKGLIEETVNKLNSN